MDAVDTICKEKFVMTSTAPRRDVIPPLTASRRVDRPGLPSGPRRAAWILLSALAIGGCVTESEPRFKTVVHESFSIEPVDRTSRLRLGDVTIDDLGEVNDVVPPLRVQACDGPHLKFTHRERKTKDGKKVVRKHPVFETVDPFEGAYVRRLKIRNDTRHVLHLNRVDAVLLDAAGNDNEMMTKLELRHGLRAMRPCPSTRGIIDSMRGVKLLGANMRIRPGRAEDVFVAFTGVDQRILGAWSLELHDVPVLFHPGGRVRRVESFRFPLLARGFRTTITLRKEGLLDPWSETHRVTSEIGVPSRATRSAGG